MRVKSHFYVGVVACFFILMALTIIFPHQNFALPIDTSDIPGGSFWTYFIIMIFAAAAGSILPDKMEPPGHKHHRGTYHSKDMWKLLGKISGGLAVVALITLALSLGLVAFFAFQAFVFVFSYFLHLTTDHLTPRGLPGTRKHAAPKGERRI